MTFSLRKILFTCGVLQIALLQSQDLSIPNGETFYISSGTTVISKGSVSVASGGVLTNNGELQVQGNLSNSGTLTSTSGTLTFNGTSAQSVGANAVVKDINIGSSASVTLTSALTIQGGTNYGKLTVSNGGVLATGGYLTLQSNANGTAVVGVGSTSGSYITGNTTVERYIPARRAFRLISPSVTTTTTIYQNWQESGSSSAGYGTHITGSGGSTNGFDETFTNNSSLFAHNNSNGTWSSVGNTNTNKLTAGTPLRLFVRGDRTTDLTNNAAASSNTVLRATGVLGQGNTTVSNLNQNASGFSMVGNPFCAPVNMADVLTKSSNLNTNFYTVWDPNMSTRGAYVTVSLPGGTNSAGSEQDEFLQPGQAAFVQTASAGSASLTFIEDNKAVTSSQTDVFRLLPPQSSLNLRLYQKDSFYNGAKLPLDALEVSFDPAFSNDFELKDARKAINQDENLSAYIEGQYCSYESRNIPSANEMVDLRLSQLRHSSYVIRAYFTGELGINSYILDNYTGKRFDLNSEGETIIEIENDGTKEANVNQRISLFFENQSNGIQNQNDVNYKIYPNPINAGAQVNVFGFNNSDIKEVQIKNSIGQTIQTERSNKFNISNNLNPGIYYIEIVDLKGHRCVKQFIVQ